MSLSAAMLRKMQDMGLTIDQAVELAEMWEEGASEVVPVSAAALRQRRYRERQKERNGDATRDVTNDATKDAPAHVGDNKPTSENNKLTSPRFSASTFEKPSKADLDALDVQLAAALGPAMASKAVSPKLFDLSPILGLLRGGQGPPADLEADVLPTLRAAAARSSPGSIKTWAYFVPAIREARDRRLSGAPIVQLVPANERPNTPAAKRTEREANYARAVAGAGVFAGD